MWESITTTLTSENGPKLLITIGILVLIIIYLAV